MFWHTYALQFVQEKLSGFILRDIMFPSLGASARCSLINLIRGLMQSDCLGLVIVMGVKCTLGMVVSVYLCFISCL